jgi:hypothetical protein
MAAYVQTTSNPIKKSITIHGSIPDSDSSAAGSAPMRFNISAFSAASSCVLIRKSPTLNTTPATSPPTTTFPEFIAIAETSLGVACHF